MTTYAYNNQVFCTPRCECRICPLNDSYTHALGSNTVWLISGDPERAKNTVKQLQNAVKMQNWQHIEIFL